MGTTPQTGIAGRERINGAPVAPIHPSESTILSVAFPQPPEMIRKQSPYDGIPSLYDM